MKDIHKFGKPGLITFFLLFTVCMSLAQTTSIKKMEAEADHYFNFDQNYEALNLYLKIDSLRPNDPKILARIGICYLFNIKSRALPYLEKATALNYKGDHLDYYLARAYHLNHQFDKAALLYAQSKGSLKSKDVKGDVDLFIRNCTDAKVLIKDSIHVKIENLGNRINTPLNDYAPVISLDESTIFFTSQKLVQNGKRKNDYYSDDIMVSHKVNGQWQAGESIGASVNTNSNEGSISLSLDGQELYIYKSDSLNPNGGSIYVSKRDGEKWSIPGKLNSRVNSEDGWEPSLSIGPNEDYVFFTSDRPGGFGGSDIYISKKSSYNEWGKPKNLGPLINTPYDEDAPYLHPDGKTLYFSSKGHPSIGGYDIFTTTYSLQNDSVTKPVNLGYPINTADDEIFFVWSADGSRGYFSSVREDTYGKSDIYMVTRPNVHVDLILLSGNVKTTENKVVPAIITIRDNETNKIIAIYDSTKFKSNFAISLDPGRNYGISIEAAGYLTYSENINIPVNGFHDIRKDIALVPLDKGGLIVLNNVFFDPGKSELKEKSLPEIDRYLSLIKKNPQILVEIAGHAFDFEDHKSNLLLSEERAKAVVNYLISKGINPDNLKGVGYGDRFKVTDVSNDDERLNSRTEFIIREALKKGEKKEKSLGYYYENEQRAMEQSKREVNNSINNKLKEQTGYLVKKDEDVYFGINNAKTIKEFKVNDEVKNKVNNGQLKPVVLKGKVKNNSTGNAIESLIIITDAEGKKVSETRTSEDGSYEVDVFNTKEKKYTITVQAQNYNYKSKDITVPANASVKKELRNDFLLSSIEVGGTYIVRNIYFDFNAATFKEESFKELKKLEKLLKNNKGLKVLISAHTDNKGSDDFNINLSQKRAEAVVRYLVSKGINTNRFVAKGYGESRPLATNDDESEGRELNRRIEFQVLEK